MPPKKKNKRGSHLPNVARKEEVGQLESPPPAAPTGRVGAENKFLIEDNRNLAMPDQNYNSEVLKKMNQSRRKEHVRSLEALAAQKIVTQLKEEHKAMQDKLQKKFDGILNSAKLNACAQKEEIKRLSLMLAQAMSEDYAAKQRIKELERALKKSKVELERERKAHADTKEQLEKAKAMIADLQQKADAAEKASSEATEEKVATALQQQKRELNSATSLHVNTMKLDD